MPSTFPVVTIQCDWIDVLRLMKGEFWISSKYRDQNSIHDKIKALVNQADGKLQIKCPDTYQYLSHSNLSLVLKHLSSGLKVAFVAPTKTHNVHKKALLSISSGENALAVSSCEEDKLLVWDTRTDEILLDLKGHGGPVYKCRLFPSNVVLISAGADGSCRIWSAESGINPVTLIGHKMSISDLAIIDKGRNVLSVSKDGTAKLWDVGESRCIDNILEGHGPINCCAIANSVDEVTIDNDREVGTGNKLLVAGCESGLIICAHVGKRTELYKQQLDSSVNACIIIDQVIIAGCSDGKIVFINVQDGSIIRDLHESNNPVLSLATLVNNMFVVGRQDGTCTVFSMNDSHIAIRVQLTGSDCDGIRDIAFNGKWILTACRDGKIRKYDYNQITVHYK
ncbi:proteasomal ATPase-associated factor 1 [Papilio machaon]|uniref:proteasomal ATPase-associated factor 1 n=1 Tax=Papilio machaon TaxID=76193 RepID=UPI001E6661F0|nr:proteasomal ATPase-associated factor 1 [Papilio machaon]XP_045538109.1 proteasomal ATPase-associated factor 1 [Papilio machaon]